MASSSRSHSPLVGSRQSQQDELRRTPLTNSIPIVDLFAGPGGLGEGFSSLRGGGRQKFSIVLSIEKDPVAHKTLELRAFFRQFASRRVPEDYYRLLRGEISRAELFRAFPAEAALAASEAWCFELGQPASEAVRQRIAGHLRGRTDWVLIGGPPCQAYSSIGRSRNKGEGGYVPELDPRQYLYREYLQVLAEHRPAVFVMENVKGLLSASLKNTSVFDQIVDDLREPASALRRHGRHVAQVKGVQSSYRICSLERAVDSGTGSVADFVVRAERHGIPQARHRVILVGVRDDIDASMLGSLKVCDPVDAKSVIASLPRLRSGLTGEKDSGPAWKATIQRAIGSAWLSELRLVAPVGVVDKIEATVEALSTPRCDRGGEFIPRDGTSEHNEWFADPRIGGVCNHSARGHMPGDLHRYLFASCYAAVTHRSPTLSDFPTGLLPEHASVSDALSGGNFSDRFRVQVGSRPSTTITSHIAKDGHYYIHYDPSQCRSLTVREAARIQTFPDNYLFCGGRTDQYRQVGNAVPPLMAREIAGIVSSLLS